jgi:diguanylate cyclase (GGDEF)-like protein/PAS domain S-box-containing protein
MSPPSSPESITLPGGRAPWWRRLHGALMPDYNRKATAYWWSAVALGALAIGWSIVTLSQRDAVVWAQVAAGTAIAMLAGLFPVRVSHSKNSFAAGEVFIFLLLLMQGPAAAVLAAAGEAFVGSCRSSKRWTSRIVSPAMAALSMNAAGHGLMLVLAWLGGPAAANAGVVMVAAMLAATAYFLLNTVLITSVPRLKSNQPFRARDLIGMFGWVGIAWAGSAAVAALLYLVYLVSGIGVLMGTLPLTAMLLATLHYFFRQQEASEAARRAGAEAAERHAELAMRHMRELEASERRFHSAFTHASIGMALLDFEGRILQANEALRELLGHDESSLVQRPFQHVVLDEDRDRVDAQFAAITAAIDAADSGFDDGFALELRCRHREGHVVWVAVHCSFFSEPGTASPCLILQVQDVSARRAAEEGLHHLAFHDSLTGLPNRRRFHELLAHAVARTQTGEGLNFAVMFLDFDRFKLINDSLGHDAGDEFLIQVAQRIHESLRPGDIVARLGGDEFGVLVQHMDGERGVVMLAERLMDALKRPFVVGGTELMTSASIGITFSAFGYTTPEEVLRDADTAMYKAKAAGKARYALFDSSLHTEVANRLRLEGDLRRAIDEGQLAVAYQPVFDLGAGAHAPRLAGFEALVRWAHPQDGAISPAAFLPIAEEAGLMLRLTDFVLHCACRQLREWQQLDPALADLTMNVNVSGHDIAHPAFAARISRAIVESGLQARHLILELTENILMARLEGALPALAELRQLGVGLAVDDFGTGYSSLAHLATLPIDVLKIDRSFVDRLELGGSNEAAVVRSIVLLGSSLGKEIVAEGIETDSQLEQLRSMGCRYGQGFLLARPVPAADITRALAGGAGGSWHRGAPPARHAAQPGATMLH